MQPHLKAWIVERTGGYCGADIKALCSEAALVSLRRAYPTVYDSTTKLEIDTHRLQPSWGDFEAALQKVVPASRRAVTAVGRALPPASLPLLGAALQAVLRTTQQIFHPAEAGIKRFLAELAQQTTTSDGAAVALGGALVPTAATTAATTAAAYELLADGDDEAWVATMADSCSGSGNGSGDSSDAADRQNTHIVTSRSTTYQPRLMLCGPSGAGQVEVARALLQVLDAHSCFSLEMGALLADPQAGSPEQALLLRLHEALRVAPSCIFIPDVLEWWRAATPPLRSALTSALNSVPSDAPVFWVSTCTSQTNTASVPAGMGPSGVALAPSDELVHESLEDGLGDVLCMLSGYDGSKARQQGYERVFGDAAVQLDAPSDEGRRAFFAPFFSEVLGLPAKVHSARLAMLLTRSQSLQPAAEKKEVEEDSEHEHGQEQDRQEVGLRRSSRSAVLNSEVQSPKRETGKPPHSPKKKSQPTKREREQNAIYFSGDLDDYPQRDTPYGFSESDRESADQRDAYHLRELRNFHRLCLAELVKDKRYQPFSRPVDPEGVPDYYDIVQCPMDLDTMRSKVGDGLYPSIPYFLRDLEQIAFNAKEYNPCTLKDTRGRQIVANAKAMADTVEAYAYRFKRNLGYDLFRRCEDVCARRGIPPPLPKPRTADELPPTVQHFYTDVLALHEEVREELGDEHPTVVKAREEEEALQAAKEAKLERAAAKEERARQRLESMQSSQSPREGEDEAGAAAEMQVDEHGMRFSRVSSSPSGALFDADDDPEAFFRRKRRAAARLKREQEAAAAAAAAADAAEEMEVEAKASVDGGATEGGVPMTVSAEQELDGTDTVESIQVQIDTPGLKPPAPQSPQATTDGTAAADTSPPSAPAPVAEFVPAPGLVAAEPVALPPLTEETALQLPSMVLLTASVLGAGTPSALQEVSRLLDVVVQNSQGLSVSELAGKLASLTRAARMFEKHRQWNTLLADLRAAVVAAL